MTMTYFEQRRADLAAQLAALQEQMSRAQQAMQQISQAILHTQGRLAEIDALLENAAGTDGQVPIPLPAS